MHAPVALEPASTMAGAAAGPSVTAAGAAGAAGAAAGVVVAVDLGPADVAALANDRAAAIATVGGAPLSHASIVARSLGIPAVAGVGPEILRAPAGTLALVDGDAGFVELAPTAEAIEAARARQDAGRRRREEARRSAAEPAATQDGLVVPVVANVGGAGDARAAVQEGADGVGMLRTEFAFLGRPAPPTEDEQFDAYRGVAAALGDRPLVVRTLDLGADVPAWGAPPEPNPALGNRGLRYTLSRPELLESQLRAVNRLARERPIGVMFPMVTTVEELETARTAVQGATIGITVEVPAAAIVADAFAPRVDFFAIGTNDLTQYTLACDRANPEVAALADGLHPAVLRLIQKVTGTGRPVCVVGELATDPLAIPILVGLGVTSFSVRPNAVAAVKQAVRAVLLDRARAQAAAALAAESAPAVRRLLSPP